MLLECFTVFLQPILERELGLEPSLARQFPRKVAFGWDSQVAFRAQSPRQSETAAIIVLQCYQHTCYIMPSHDKLVSFRIELIRHASMGLKWRRRGVQRYSRLVVSSMMLWNKPFDCCTLGIFRLVLSQTCRRLRRRCNNKALL